MSHDFDLATPGEFPNRWHAVLPHMTGRPLVKAVRTCQSTEQKLGFIEIVVIGGNQP